MTFTCTGWAFIAVQLTCTMPDTAPAVVCPPVRAWSQDFQKLVATELRAAPNSALAAVAVQAIGDRDIARACARRKKAGK
ncbi:hypothetical protein [Bradyrhizobium erythrophlei]|uniref:Uncharacterized protein n=1 Tax=Bradyrhizobium erythrophlei TaxID=1437360 RepID=A0A1H4NZN6_9BRAD|nr:hypothetical protein [Bradyrhizobium erythrophlei]SEC00142.1 hypothetical protein SAMN05444164_0767 [Bradyrhizobium erythrophlei]